MNLVWLLMAYILGGIMGFMACAIFTAKAVLRTEKNGRKKILNFG